MKSLLVFALFLGVVSFSVVKASEVPTAELDSAIASAAEDAGPDSSVLDDVCTAQTPCRRGAAIGCRSTGYRCNARVVAYRSVYCIGYGADGSYVEVVDYCR